MNKLLFVATLSLATVSLFSCSKNKSEPVVMSIKQEKNAAPTTNPLATNNEAVTTTIQLRKSTLLNREFLYSASLQHSSIVSEEISVSYMGLNLGVIPAEFKIIDDKLRFVSDARISFESDVNHPSRLIHEFPIIAQDAESITIKANEASPILATALFDVKAGPTRVSWIRSLSFEQADELFLIESTLDQADGSLAEIMESIRPRDKAINKNFKPIYNNPELNADMERFRFIGNSEVFVNHPEHGRIKTSFAQHYDISEGKVISWYVTANIPDEYLNDVKTAIEGWNRYSQAMWKKDIVKFEGKLPEGIKIGDPRYNIVLWDEVKDAGAAYESQNSDPITGHQFNSMIYLPKAWVNIAKEYWNSANYSEEDQEKKTERVRAFVKNKTLMGKKLPVNCIDSAHMHVNLQAKENLEEFSHSLLKGVLFHEMGHALGLAHNFKGSLIYDLDKNDGKFSTTIMDYNNYNVESAAFNSVESADGPLLEYDRQILSVLYNEGKDIKSSDPVLPACSDEESDSMEGGIDPLCIRYDSGMDPTKTPLKALELYKNPEAFSGRISSLPKALARTLKNLPDASKVEDIDSVVAELVKMLLAVKGTTGFYGGEFYRGVMNASRSLHVFREGSLPESDAYVEKDMRDRALQSLKEVMNLKEYPAATKAAIANVKTEIEKWILSTAVMAQLSAEEREQIKTLLMAQVDGSLKSMETTQLSKMRARVAGELTYSPDAPYSFQQVGSEVVDVEQVVINYLSQLAIEQRPLTERAAGIVSLITFKNEAGSKATSALRTSIEAEIKSTQDAMTREVLRKFLQALK